MKKIVLALVLLYAACSISFAGTFSETVPVIQKALLTKDMAVLNKHVDLDSIIRAKVRKYAFKAQKKGSLLAKTAGKAANLGEGAIVASLSRLTLSEYGKSSLALRQAYLSQVNIKLSGNKKQIGFVSGTFMGYPFYASAVLVKDTWVIIGVESVLIDAEVKNALRGMHIL